MFNNADLISGYVSLARDCNHRFMMSRREGWQRAAYWARVRDHYMHEARKLKGGIQDVQQP